MLESGAKAAIRQISTHRIILRLDAFTKFIIVLLLA